MNKSADVKRWYKTVAIFLAWSIFVLSFPTKLDSASEGESHKISLALASRMRSEVVSTDVVIGSVDTLGNSVDTEVRGLDIRKAAQDFRRWLKENPKIVMGVAVALIAFTAGWAIAKRSEGAGEIIGNPPTFPDY